MASLQELLAEEGFERGKYMKSSVTMKPRCRMASDESTALPIHICQDRKSFDFLSQKSGKTVIQNQSLGCSSKRVGSVTDRSSSKSLMKDSVSTDEPAIDEVAIRAVVSILSGYIGRYTKDESFRGMIREKCNTCLGRRKKESDNAIFANMEQGIDSVDRLVQDTGTKQELRMKLLRNSIRLLSIVASLNSKRSRNGSTSGVPNSHLSACAQLYLSIIYKLEKNDRISARHLLQVFCDSPFLARTNLLPDLWDLFFLPHLLHLKVWYHKELEFFTNFDYGEREKRMEDLSKAYTDLMDMGTTQFALYYKKWLKVGAEAPAVPTVPLPSIPSYGSSRRRLSDSNSSHSTINRNLYQAVFGPKIEHLWMDFDHQSRASISAWGQEQEKVSADDDHSDINYVHNKTKTHRRSASQGYRNRKAEWQPETRKSDYLRFFTCQSLPTECLVNGDHVGRNDSFRREENTHLPSSDLTKAINTVCSSDSLSDCEFAIRVITKAWLDSHSNPANEAVLSKAPVIEGMLEVLFVSNDDEVLELAISMLAEFVSRKEINKQIILNLDPQLQIFLRLLRSSFLFLKAAVLLYLLKPKAKQMISAEWVPLVLRVLEFGDRLQTLFSVRCSPQVAAFYLLDQLLTGFDEDRNLENACEVVSLGGLNLLIRSIETGDVHERNNAAMFICCCIQANASCRNYLADNVNKASLLELIVLGNQRNSNTFAFMLLTELLCLDRRTRIIRFLKGLKEGWGGLNAMHIFLVYLQKASPEELPLVAAILLQLDLLGDQSKCSIYREDAVEAIIAALDCQTCDKQVQEQSARALIMLGDRCPCTGQATTEGWLLEQAGFSENSFGCNDALGDQSLIDEEEATENWQKKAACALLDTGRERFLAALSSSIANGIPNLARVCLYTISWISNFIDSVGGENFRTMACSVLVPQLLKSSGYDRAQEEKILATNSLQHLVKGSDYASLLSSLDRELLDPLQNPW